MLLMNGSIRKFENKDFIHDMNYQYQDFICGMNYKFQKLLYWLLLPIYVLFFVVARLIAFEKYENYANNKVYVVGLNMVFNSYVVKVTKKEKV